MRATRYIRLALWTSAGLCVVLVLAVLALHLPAARRAVWNRIRDAVGSSYGVRLSSSGFRYNLFALTFEIDDLSVSLGDGSAGPLLEADEVTFDIALWRSLLEVVTIEDARIEGARVRLPAGIDLNGIGSSEAPSNAGFGLPVRIDALRVQGESFVFDDAERQVSAAAGDWRLTLLGEASGYRMDLGFDQTRVRAGGFDFVVAPLTSALEMADDQIRVETFQAVSSLGSLVLDGRVTDFPTPRFDLHAVLGLDLGAVFPEWASGNVETEADVTNGIDNLSVAATTRGDDIVVDRLDGGSLHASWSWLRSENRVSVSALDLDGPLGSLGLTGEMSVDGAAGRGQASLELSGVDLAEITQTLELPVQIRSRVSGNMDASWEGLDWESLVGSGQLALATLPPPGDLVAPGTVPVSGTLSFDVAAGNVSARTDGLQAGPLALRANVVLGPERALSGEARVTTEDVSLVVDAVRSFSGATNGSPGSYPTGAATATLSLGGTWSDPTMAFGARAPALSFRGFRDIAVSMEGRYASKSLGLESLALESDGQRMTGQGTLDLEPGPGRIDLRLEGSNISVPAVLEGLGAAQSLPVGAEVEGRFDFESDIDGTLTEPRVALVLDGSDISAYGIVADAVRATVDWDGNTFDVRDLRLTSETGAGTPSLLTGTFRYAGETEEFALHLEGSDLPVGGLPPIGGQPLAGTARFVADGSGSLSDPSAQVDLTLGDAAWGPVSLGDLHLTSRLADRRLQATLDLPEQELHASSDVELTGDLNASLSVEVDGLDLAGIGPLLPERLRPAAGRIRGALDASGPIRRWRDGSLHLELAQTSARLGNVDLMTMGETVIDYASGRFRLAPVVLVAGGQEITIQGELPLDEAGAPGVIRADGALDVGEVWPLLVNDGNLDVAGTLMVDLELEGRVTELRPMLTARLAGGTLSAEWLPEAVREIEADLRVAGNTIDVDDFRADWSGAMIEGSASAPLGMLLPEIGIPVDPAAHATLMTSITGLDLAAIPGMPAEAGGRADARLELQASALSLNALEGRLVFDTLAGSFADVKFEQDQPVTVSLSAGRVEIGPFHITGPRTDLQGSGELGLRGSDALRLDLTGRATTIGFASASGNTEVSGNLSIDLHVGGTVGAPMPSGELGVENARLSVTEPVVQLTNFVARIRLAPDALTLESATGMFNGGTLEATGMLAYRGRSITEGGIDVRVEDVFTDIPQGLMAVSEADLRIEAREQDVIAIGGNVRILGGTYSRNIELATLLLEYVSSTGSADLATEPNPILSRIRYDVGINTVEPIVIDNNIAQVQADVSLQLVGTWYRPGLLGRIVLDEGGEIRIQDRQFVLDTGTIDLTSPNRIEPSLNILARTEYRGYDITVQINGGGENLETTMTSDPSLSEPDIVSLLLTGRTLEEVQGQELDVAREQALFVVAGTLGNRLAQRAEETLGFGSVRIDPELIANQENPGARLTVGQNLTTDLELIYSMNLADSKDQIWIAQYSIRPRLLTRGIIEQDNAYRVEAQHALAFGAPPPTPGRGAPAPAPSRELGTVRISPPSFDDRDLSSVFDVKTGRRYNFFDIQRGTERLQRFFSERDYLESRVRLDRETVDGRVDFDVDVDPGPRVQLDFQGAKASKKVARAARDAWRDSTFDELRGRRAIIGIRGALISEGFLEADASYETMRAGDLKTVTFQLDPGPRYRHVEIAFEGLSASTESELKRELENAGLWNQIHTQPERVRDFLQLRYRTRGYRDATVDPFRYTYDPDAGRARLVIRIHEGPLFHFSDIRFEGNMRFSSARLAAEFPLAGQPASLDRLDEAESGIEQLYWQNGYNDVVVERSLMDSSTPDAIDVDFSIRENRSAYISEIEITGERNTSEGFVRKQLTFESGEPLNFEELNVTRRRLYDTRAYSYIQFETSTIESLAGNGPDSREPVRVHLNLQEVEPYRLRYGVFYDTQGGPGVTGTLSRHNLWGGARVVGLSGRYDGQQYDARVYYSQPSVTGLPLQTNVTVFTTRSVEAEGVQTTDRRGVEVAQQVRLSGPLLLSYGFSYQKVRTFRVDPATLAAMPTPTDIAPIGVTLTRDTRDSYLDPRTGWFTSHAVSYGTRGLGSSSAFLGYFGQLFNYFPISAPRRIPLTGQVKPRWLLATGVRVGLVGGLGGDPVAQSEKFFSGGGTTVRGFKQDFLGPVDSSGNPTGGNAVLTLNTEIRFPLFSIFEGVGFVDAGNVYDTIADFDPFDIRPTSGFGLRLRTPYFLLRADYGVKLDRRPGESFGRFFFSIGQAF